MQALQHKCAALATRPLVEDLFPKPSKNSTSWRNGVDGSCDLWWNWLLQAAELASLVLHMHWQAASHPQRHWHYELWMPLAADVPEAEPLQHARHDVLHLDVGHLCTSAATASTRWWPRGGSAFRAARPSWNSRSTAAWSADLTLDLGFHVGPRGH